MLGIIPLPSYNQVSINVIFIPDCFGVNYQWCNPIKKGLNCEPTLGKTWAMLDYLKTMVVLYQQGYF